VDTAQPGSTRVGWIGTGCVVPPNRALTVKWSSPLSSLLPCIRGLYRVMGGHMCGHLLSAGYNVTLYTRFAPRRALLCAVCPTVC
jgi:hypothetical protein